MPFIANPRRTPARKYCLELFQESRTAESLLHHIVRSKRLLADHIELLESCNLPAENVISMAPTPNQFTLLRTVGLVSASIVSFNVKNMRWPIIKYVVPMTAAAYGACYSIKAFFTLRRIRLEHVVCGLLVDLDSADSAIRKNICYLRETNFLRGISKDKCESNEIVQKCLESTIKLIKLIYDEVQSMERIRLPEQIESKYQPMEDLSDCVYFQRNAAEYTADDIKDFFNIFLYFQSQLLVRLCLVIVYRSDEAYIYFWRKMHSLRTSIQLETDRLTESLPFADGQALLRDKLQALNDIDKSTVFDSLPLARVKRGSLDLMCRLIAMTNEYRNTDDCIQAIAGDHRLKKDVFIDIAHRMIQIEQSMAACKDDYRCMRLTYDKFLFTTFRINPERKTITAADKEVHAEKSSDASVSDSKKRAKNHSGDDNSDYFALRDSNEIMSESEAEDDNLFGHRKRGNFDDDLDNLDVKLSQKNFAPVLKQLKSKINPINDAMKERELKFLMAKGVDRDRIVSPVVPTVKGDASVVDSDSDSDVSIVMPRSRPRKNYDEMRTFLQQKQQFAIIPPTLPPINALGDEEILE